ncbi:MAG TPA: mersacidin/lichenicidin family type 2 lantibiotic [Ktedonobacteraceae bacterium]|nr:mersacidin/lichenicidin family type 2 lantibiotic [Ktedonobacteraceae bacterium]
MSNEEITKAWKDEEYREDLEQEKREQLPENPAGDTDLSEEELKGVEGAGEVPHSPTVSVLVSIAATAAATQVVTQWSAANCNSLVHGGSCAVGSDGCC